MANEDPNKLNGASESGVQTSAQPAPASGEQSAATQKQEKGYILKKHYVKNVNFQYLLQHPESYKITQTPELNINVKTTPTDLGNDDFDVALVLEIKGTSEGQSLFETSVSYAGIFSIKNLNEQEKNGLLGVECPHLLYPFARRIAMDLILESGFPAATLPPINFAILYAKQQQQRQQQAQTEATGGSASTSTN